MITYDVILADPPWRFKTYSAKGRGRSPDGDIGKFHYETMSLDDIMAINMNNYASKNCVLYIWATAPMLPQALMTMQAWGFGYKSNLCWDKERAGTGYWFRNAHEHLLIGTRGSGMCPPPHLRRASVIYGGLREHSRKPDESYRLIESYHPEARKIEFFAREQRQGWDCWGDETEKFNAL